MAKQISPLEHHLQSFERKQVTVSFLGLVILLTLSVLANRIFMLGAAEHTSRLITRLSQIADFRDVSLTLQEAHLVYFSKIQYHSKPLNRSFTIPPIADYDDKQAFWRTLIFETIELKTSAFGPFSNQDKIIFEYNRFNFFSYALSLWILLVVVSIPQTRLMKKRITAQYYKELALQKDFFESKQQAEKSKVYELLARQVSHDIRSPLSALTMVTGTLNEISEDKRILIRNATQRINDIANDLLQKGQETEPEHQSFNDNSCEYSKNNNSQVILTTNFIPTFIDILVSEKRMQYREYEGLEIEVDLKSSFGAFAKTNSIELKRAVSNLINNAVEALDNHQGRVVIGVKKVEYENTPRVEIFVKDNGKGIPKHVLEKLGQMGVTDGKKGTQSGSGLGVYHAKKTAESSGGSLQIDSSEGQGTIIRIILPLAEGPEWFADKIDLTGKEYLISLDDDISIHQIWHGRLQSLGLNEIEHIKFQSGEAFQQYVNSNITKLKRTLFLVDFELLNQSKSGLDIIEDLGIEKYSILVTSRYEEDNIQSRASRLKLPLLPKALAGFVPIKTNKSREIYDWILLDDDELVHMSWEIAAKETKNTFIGFKTLVEFDAYKMKIDLNSKIFIDSNLGNGIKGENIAKLLHAENFKNLYLATGYPADMFPSMEFTKAIVGKEPPITC